MVESRHLNHHPMPRFYRALSCTLSRTRTTAFISEFPFSNTLILSFSSFGLRDFYIHNQNATAAISTISSTTTSSGPSTSANAMPPSSYTRRFFPRRNCPRNYLFPRWYPLLSRDERTTMCSMRNDAWLITKLLPL